MTNAYIRQRKKERFKEKRGWWWKVWESTPQKLYLTTVFVLRGTRLLRPYAAEVWKTGGTYYAWRVGQAKGAAPTLREAMRTAHAMEKMQRREP